MKAVALAFTRLAAALIAAEPPSTPRLKGEFGVWDAETNGTPKLLPTRVVPLELGMMYGWRIQLTNKVESVRVKQVLTLPGAPQNWGTSTGIRLSADRRTATIETKQKPVDGWIFDIIRKINAENGTTIFLVEQNANLALKVAHRGYVMENGSISLTDSAENLLKNDEVRKAYLGI